MRPDGQVIVTNWTNFEKLLCTCIHATQIKIINATFENPQCEDDKDRLVTTDQQKKESQVCCLSCLYISNSYNKCTRGKCFAPIFFSTLCSWQQKNLCVPQTETVVEHITEILSSIGQIGLTMLLFLVILGFAPSKVQGLIQRCCCCCCCCCCLWALERGVVGARWRWRRPWRCWSCSALAQICPSRCRSGPARRRAA